MVSTPTQSDPTELFYPCEDGEPLAESFEHLCVIFATFSILTQYLRGQQATVLADQFLYYVEGQPSDRVAPDVMVIFNVAPGGRGNYKIWEEGEVPSVIFEMTSEGTRKRDWGFKKDLYAQLGVQEYWLFDPQGEWIPEQLQGYRLDETGTYQRITDDRSEVLQLQLRPEGTLIEFYRLDTHEKLLTPDELLELSEQAQQTIEQVQTQVAQQQARAEQEQTRAEQERSRAEQEQTRAEQERSRAEQERSRAEQEQTRAEQERSRAEQEQTRAEQERSRAEQEQARAEQERQRADQEKARADQLAARLRELGIDL